VRRRTGRTSAGGPSRRGAARAPPGRRRGGSRRRLLCFAYRGTAERHGDRLAVRIHDGRGHYGVRVDRHACGGIRNGDRGWAAGRHDRPHQLIQVDGRQLAGGQPGTLRGPHVQIGDPSLVALDLHAQRRCRLGRIVRGDRDGVAHRVDPSIESDATNARLFRPE
jgi:hypothetical protein